jgi:hypothetical protein
VRLAPPVPRSINADRKGDIMTDESQFSYDEERGQYQWELEIVLEQAVDNYASDREDYFREGAGKGKPELKWLLDSAGAFAEALLKATGDLVSDDKDAANAAVFMDDYDASKEETFEKTLAKFRRRGVLPEQLAMLPEIFRKMPFVHLDQDSPARLVWEHLCINLAGRWIGEIGDAAHRLFDLWGLVISARPCPASQQFLRRVSRCYVAEFDTECIILCRGVLDTAFRELSLETGTLKKRIDAAAEANRISAKVERAANDVRVRGNKAIHDEPDLQVDALDVIRDTLTVVEAIAG